MHKQMDGLGVDHIHIFHRGNREAECRQGSGVPQSDAPDSSLIPSDSSRPFFGPRPIRPSGGLIRPFVASGRLAARR